MTGFYEKVITPSLPDTKPGAGEKLSQDTESYPGLRVPGLSEHGSRQVLLTDKAGSFLSCWRTDFFSPTSNPPLTLTG